MLVTNVLLFVLLLSNVALLAVALGALYKARRLIDVVQNTISDFFNSPDADTPSPFAQLVDKSAAVFSARLVTSAQAAIRGSAGGAQKSENAAAAAEAAASNPLLALLGGSKLGKSPLAMAGLSLLGNQLFANKNGSNHTGSDSGSSSAPRFKF